VTPAPDDLATLRREYEDHGLDTSDLGDEPLSPFRRWLADATVAGMHEPNAMVVCTVGEDGPSARMVLLKGVDERGFVFYTNYGSRKAEELTDNSACALVFPWHPLQRQVRVEGTAARLSAEESDAYFAIRPRPAQIGAWASPQSQIVPSREFLEDRYLTERDRFADVPEVPRPPHWGGFLVRPHRVEFWQGRSGRMHDRFRFDRTDEWAWAVERLAP
jgi:pyridoxamine 5'-phosphate oxidase